jgi:hypothetical protein
LTPLRTVVIMAVHAVPKCAAENPDDATRCRSASDSLSVAVLEVIRGEVPEKIRFLKPRSYEVGARTPQRHRAQRAVDLQAPRPHRVPDGRFFIEDAGSMHGVYVNAAKVRRAELAPGAQVQLGNVTLKFLARSATRAPPVRWASCRGSSSSSCCSSWCRRSTPRSSLSPVLEQVTDAIMQITGAERGFLLPRRLLPSGAHYPSVAGLRAARRARTQPMPPRPTAMASRARS